MESPSPRARRSAGASPAASSRGEPAPPSRASDRDPGDELDQAFLRWFATRLVTLGPDACEADVTAYVIALALREAGPERRMRR